MRVIQKVLVLAALWCGVQVFNLAAADQDIIIEGAKKEGVLIVYTSMTVDQMQKILDAFKSSLFLHSNDHVPRCRRETAD